MIIALTSCLAVAALLLVAAGLCRSGAAEDAWLQGYASGWGEGFEYANEVTARDLRRMLADQAAAGDQP